MKKLILLLTSLFLIGGMFGQNISFKGKAEYVKEIKIASGNYEAKNNGKCETYFNAEMYAYVVNSTIDYQKMVDKTISSIPSQFANDSFEIARQRAKILAKLQDDTRSVLRSETFVDYNTNVLTRPREVNGQRYCVIDTLGKLNFELKEDTIRIDGILCQKARVFVVDRFFSVWFAPSIPFSAGPFNLHGLPGLILLATSEDEKIRYRMTNLNFPLEVPQVLSFCNGGKQIASAAFNALQEERRAAMQNRRTELLKNKVDD